MASPTQRSLKLLRDEGYTAEVTERWNQWARVRQDLFGVIDIVAVKAGCPVLGVQTTSASNVSARIKKAKASPKLAVWLSAPARFVIHGWKKGVRGELAVRVVELQQHDVTTETLQEDNPGSREGHKEEV